MGDKLKLNFDGDDIEPPISIKEIFEEFPALIFRVNIDKKIDYCNETFSNFIGENITEEISDNIKSKVHYEDFTKTYKLCKDSFVLQKSFEFESRLKNSHEEYKWMLINGRPFYNIEKKFCGYIIVAYDINKYKESQEKLKQAKEVAETSERAKSSFLANMSHEIRTPLNGIDGMIDLTLHTELTADQRENLEIARDCSDSLIEVINNILDFSKIEANKMEIKETEFKIRDLVEKTVNSNAVHAKNKGIELLYNIGIGLDEALLGDFYKIQQVLNNLVSNAIKFTNIGKVFIDVEKDVEEDNAIYLRINVKDTGIGISNEDMGKLFNSFSQVDDSYTRKYGGTGLGLAISKKLVEMMGGKIEAKSIKGKGSTFYFTIKLKRLQKNETLLPAVEEKSAKNIYSSLTKSILIVEDDIANQKVITRMCNEMKHRVEIAYNGEEAIEILKSKSFDLILMDIQMPIMDGIRATKIIRENEKKTGKHIPIIALTAYAINGDKEKFLNEGMDDYLSKPVNMENLYNCIENIILNNDKLQLVDGVITSQSSADIKDDENNLEYRSIYIQKISEQIDELSKSLKIGNIKDCEKFSHIIKEYSLKVNSVILKNASFRAELASRRKDLIEIEKQINIIEEEFNRIKKKG